MLLCGLIGAVVAGLLSAAAASVVPAGIKEIDKVYIPLTGIRQSCLSEELPRDTVLLGNYPRPITYWLLILFMSDLC